MLCLYCGEQRAEIAARGGDLKVRLSLEESPDAFADEIVVLREHEPDRHEMRIRR
jgi:hypothetical protein